MRSVVFRPDEGDIRRILLYLQESGDLPKEDKCNRRISHEPGFCSPAGKSTESPVEDQQAKNLLRKDKKVFVTSFGRGLPFRTSEKFE